MARLPAAILLLLTAAARAAGPMDGSRRGPSVQPFIPVAAVHQSFAFGLPQLPPALPAPQVASTSPKVSGPSAPAGGTPPAALPQLDGAAQGARKSDAAPAALGSAFDGSKSRRGPSSPVIPPLPLGAPQPALPGGALPLPIVMQGTDYSCGAASLLSALLYWGVFSGNESDLYGPLQTTPQHGTEPPKLAEVARSFGLTATMKEGMTIDDLREALRHGRTVLVDFQAWHEGPAPHWPSTWDDGHYSVVAGVDDHYVYLMDPSAGPGYAFVPIQEFMDRWHDFEDRHGRRQEYRQLGIILQGDQPMKSFPGPLIPVR